MDKEKTIKIKISLLRLGVSQAQIARDLGLKRGTVNGVIQGRGRSKRIEAYLETLILQDQKMSLSKNLERDKKPLRKGHPEFRKGQQKISVISEG